LKAGGLQAPGRAWVLLSLLLGLGSLSGWWLPSVSLDWQPELAATQPWRAWSAAWVHWSGMHLWANLAGLLVLGALGWVARLPWPASAAWLAAWPLTQAGLLVQPGLAHFGGLSGVLHAGVAVAGVWLLARGYRRQRGVAAAVLAGLLVKLLLEEPWGPPLRHGGGWDIATAPLAHATGAVAGLGCALVVLLLWRGPALSSTP
jgi:rhomboid family GlyGly-CTERM serine protease